MMEQHEGMSTLLQRFFVRQEVAIQVVSNALAARAILALRPCRVLLIDLHPPYENGIALLRHVHHAAPHTRIVVMGVFVTSQLEQDRRPTGRLSACGVCASQVISARGLERLRAIRLLFGLAEE